MGTGARTLFVGLDACDLHVAREFARDGDMPTVARLLDEAAVQETVGPLGFVVGANWPTIYTGTTPTRHQFLCSGQIRGGTYENRWLTPISEPPGIWDWVTRAGGRAAVLDAPHAAVASQLNGVQLVEWGCHDRHAGTASYPETFLSEVRANYGPHLIGERSIPFPHCAPCDIAHREGAHRTVNEDRALLTDLLEAHRRKAALSVDLLNDRSWDLFFTVLGESHCSGHQFWKHHDSTHPLHDAAAVRALGGDPLRAVYSAMDASVGRLIDAAGTDATVYVLLSHGMHSHFDGQYLLEQVLWRLDEYASKSDDRGPMTRAADVAVGALPRAVRRRALATAAELRRRFQPHEGAFGTTPVEIPQWIGQRRWWMQPNDSAFGSVRLNVQGREPDGRIAATRARDAALWLADRFYELMNVESGEPAVAHVYLTDEHYERVPGDPMGDLIIDWNRNAPVDTVWSPATGIVSVPYDGWRTGDHHRGGLLLASGHGIAAGRRPGPISVVDIAPTIAASLDLDVPAFDGVARADLVPSRSARRTSTAVAPLAPAVHPVSVSRPRRWSHNALDVPADRWIEHYAVGLGDALHGQHVRLGNEIDRTRRLEDRVGELERLMQVATVGAWLRQIEVPSTLRVSVVMPTRNRSELLERAIDSVVRQSYDNWELLVVDDASDDDTWMRLQKLAENDHRIRPFRFDERRGSSRARNEALDKADGDVIAYLDDDNRFDPEWLRALAWAFTEYPGTHVCYGARIIDDDVRHQGLEGRSMPVVQFNAWDRETFAERNLIDQNVVAHRPSAARFDPAIDHMSDWDMLLQLTVERDPMPLPVVAAYYFTDEGDRLSARFRDEEYESEIVAYVRDRARVRRQAGT